MSIQEAQQIKAKRLQGDTSNRELSRIERQFLLEYIMRGQNGAEAARAMHRGGKYPDRWASVVLSRPWVRAELERRLQAREKATEASIEALVEEYRKLAFREFEGPWLASHKLQAMDRLGNHKGMFKPDVSVQVPVSFTFIGSPRHNQTVIEATSSPLPQSGPLAGIVSDGPDDTPKGR